MNNLRWRTGVACAILTSLSLQVQADDWTCTYSNLVRHVTVYYPNEPERLPCQVYYSKPTEKVMPRVLWNASNLDNYCESKAEGFIDKLRGMGWQCTRDAPPDS